MRSLLAHKGVSGPHRRPGLHSSHANAEAPRPMPFLKNHSTNKNAEGLGPGRLLEAHQAIPRDSN